MPTDRDLVLKYYLSYSGVRLPLNLVSPISSDALENRNTYFRAAYDGEGRIVFCEKLVYGEVELRHDYEYRPDGALARARVDMAGEETEITFDAEGKSSARTL